VKITSVYLPFQELFQTFFKKPLTSQDKSVILYLDIEKKKKENEMNRKIKKLLKLALKSKGDVFFTYYPHVNSVSISIYKKWGRDKKPDYRTEIYFDKQFDKRKYKEVIRRMK